MVCLLVTLLPPLIRVGDLIDWKRHHYQIEKIQYVLHHSTPSDYVHDGDIQFNLFRKDLDYFWYSIRPQEYALDSLRQVRPYDYNLPKMIQDKRPVLISNYWSEAFGSDAILRLEYETTPFPDVFRRRERVEK